MPKVILEQGSLEWHKWRDEGVGGSDAPIIVGANRWKTRHELWRHKLKLDPSEPMNDAMRRGVELEPIAREDLWHELEIEFYPACYESSKYPWMKASLDGISPNGVVAVEIKCPVKPQIEKVPNYYYPQLQHQMYVVGLEWMYYYCYHPEHSFLIEVPRDDVYINWMIELEEKFWNCVLNLTPPEFDAPTEF